MLKVTCSSAQTRPLEEKPWHPFYKMHMYLSVCQQSQTSNPRQHTTMGNIMSALGEPDLKQETWSQVSVANGWSGEVPYKEKSEPWKEEQQSNYWNMTLLLPLPCCSNSCMININTARWVLMQAKDGQQTTWESNSGVLMMVKDPQHWCWNIEIHQLQWKLGLWLYHYQQFP